MAKLLLHVFLLASTLSVHTCESRQARNVAPVIDLGYTKYQGVFDDLNNITSYLGMRYAAPPIGNNLADWTA